MGLRAALARGFRGIAGRLAGPVPSSRGRRRRTSVQSRHQDFLHDRGEFDPIGLANGDRGLTAMERMRALRFARRNDKRNGVYGELLRKFEQHTVGDGVEFTFEDETVKAHVEAVLGDRRNRFHERLGERWRETLNEGEYFLRIETDQRLALGDTVIPTGIIRFGRIEVDQVRDVRVSASDPDCLMEIEVEHAQGVRRWYPLAAPGVNPVPGIEVIDGNPVETGALVAVLPMQVGTSRGRGTPLLARILEKVELVDDVVDANARKAEYLNRFWLHTEYLPSGDAEKDEQLEDDLIAWGTQADPGEMLVTSTRNEVKPKMLAPDLKVMDQKALFDLVLEYVLGSTGVPRMWFASGGETNRATAVEQGSPIHRSLVSLQATLKQHIEALVRYVIWLGKLSGRIARETSDEFMVQMAAISTRDTQREIGVLQQLQSLLTSAVASGLLHPEEAQTIFRGAVKAQTMFEAPLQSDAPEPQLVSQTEDILNRMPEPLREAIRKELPGHRRAS